MPPTDLSGAAMDFSYLTPRCVQHLSDAVLRHAVAECRQALELLMGHRSAAGQELRLCLLRAQHSYEAELTRRTAA